MTIVVFFSSPLYSVGTHPWLWSTDEISYAFLFWARANEFCLSLSISASVDRSRSTITNSKCLAQREKTDVLFFFIHSPRNKFQSTASPPRYTIFNTCMNHRPPKVKSELNALLENQFLCPSTHCKFVDVTAEYVHCSAWISKSIPVERVKIQ